MGEKIYLRDKGVKNSLTAEKKLARRSLKIRLKREGDKVFIVRPANKELALYVCRPDFQNDSKKFWEKFPKEMERFERDGGSFFEEQPSFFEALEKFSRAHKGLSPIRPPLTLNQLFSHLSFEDSRIVGPITLESNDWGTWGCKVVIPIHPETKKEDILSIWGIVEQIKAKVYGKDQMDKRKRDEFLEQVETWIWRCQKKSYRSLAEDRLPDGRPLEIKKELNRAQKQYERAHLLIMGKKFEGAKIRSQMKTKKYLDRIQSCISCARPVRVECERTGHLCPEAMARWEKMDRKESFIQKKYIRRDKDGEEIKELDRIGSDIENPEDKMIREEESEKR